LKYIPSAKAVGGAAPLPELKETIMGNMFLKTARVAIIALLGAVLTPLALGAGAQQTQFTGFFGIINGCNVEVVVVTGAVKITYHTNQTGGEQTHYNINLRFKGTGEGSLGNHYHMSFIANGQFDAPTQDFGSFQVFDLPYRSVFISQGHAPNIEVEGTIRVFVAGGQATGALITSITSTTCHG